MRRTLLSKKRPQTLLFLFVFLATLVIPLVNIAPASAAAIRACEDTSATQDQYDHCMDDGTAFGRMNIDEQVQSYVYMTMMAGCAGGGSPDDREIEPSAIKRYEFFDGASGSARQLGIYLRGTTAYNGQSPATGDQPGYHDCNHDGGEWTTKALALWSDKYGQVHRGIDNPFSDPYLFACKVMGAVRQQNPSGSTCATAPGADNMYVFKGDGETRRDRTFTNIFNLIYKKTPGSSDYHNYELSNAQKYILYLKSFLVGCKAELVGLESVVGPPQEDHTVTVNIVDPTSTSPKGYVPTVYYYPKLGDGQGASDSTDADMVLAVRDYKQTTGDADFKEHGCAGIVNTLNNHIDPGVGGAEWRDAFIDYQTYDPEGATAANLPGVGNDEPPSPVVHCDNGDFDFIVCPAIELGVAALERLDAFVMDMLNVDVKPIFGVTNEDGANSIDDETSTAHGYYMAWSSFRVIAIAILIIAGLVMVGSQALGFEFLDAYTIRKTLPRLLVAAIGISLSWQLMRLMVQFFDTAGVGIRQLMYGPFTNIGDINIDFGSGILSTIIGGGVLLLLGPPALTFVLTALLAILVGYIALVARQLFIIVLVILAPIAIACYVLPNTQRVWRMWFDNFLGMLLAFPIISAMIAAGHILAIVATNNDDTAVLTATLTSGFASVFHIGGQQMAVATDFAVALATTAVGITAYVLPYPFIPKVLAMTNKPTGMVVNGVESLTKGWRDNIAKSRSNAMGQRWSKMRSGTLYNPESTLATMLGGRAINRIGSHVGAGFKGNFGFGATGAAARSNLVHATTDSMSREDSAFAAQANNEDTMVAVAYGNNRQKLLRLEHFQGADGARRLRNAMANAGTIRITQRTQVAALDALAKSGKVIRNRGEMRELTDSVAGGNEILATTLRGNYQYYSRQAGRADIGRDTDRESLRELDAWSMGKQKEIALENLLGDRGIAAAQAVGAPPPVLQAVADSVGEGRIAEADHIVDVLVANQYSASISPQLQQSIREAIYAINNTDFGNGHTGADLIRGAQARAQQRYATDDDVEDPRRREQL